MTEYYKENFYDEYSIKKRDTIIAIVDSGSNANKICDELNTLHEENIQLRKLLDIGETNAKSILDVLNEQEKDAHRFMQLIKNKSVIIERIHSILLEYKVKEPIILTKEDLELMGKAISYYTHGRCGE